MPVKKYTENAPNKLKEFLLFLVFSNIFIVVCSIIMSFHTAKLFSLSLGITPVLFIASGTLTSYSFHWMLPPAHKELSPRDLWSRRNRLLLLLMFAAGSAGSAYTIFLLKEHFLKVVPIILLTFLYSSGRLPRGPFIYFRKYFFGKTIYLSLMWTLVTVYLPFAFSNEHWERQHFLFFAGRFLFLFAVCILFDLRDKEADSRLGIKSLITIFSGSSIRLLFYGSLFLSSVCTVLMFKSGTCIPEILVLLFPAALTAAGYTQSIKTRSDLWFYFYLDGLMMLAGLISLSMLDC